MDSTATGTPSTAKGEVWIWPIEEISFRLSHPHGDVRAWALRRLALFDRGASFAAALRLLADAEEEVQMGAMEVLESAGTSELPSDTRQVLRTLLRKKSLPPGPREFAEGLVRSLKKGDARRASRVFPAEWEGRAADQVLQRLESRPSDGEFEEVVTYVSTRPEELRMLAPWYLGGKCTPRAMAVIECLGRQPYRWASEMIVERLQAILASDQDHAAVAALGRLADPASLRALAAEWRAGEREYAHVVRFVAQVAGETEGLPLGMAREEEGTVAGEEEAPAREPSAPPFEARCNRCRRRYSYEVEEVCVTSLEAGRAWLEPDDVVPTRIITCKNCGAIDDYVVGDHTLARITAALTHAAAPGEPGALPRWLRLRGLGLMEGSRARRPSEALARLRKEAEESPDSVVSWRRIGNFCRRMREDAQAIAAYEKALWIEPDDEQSVLGLALSLVEMDRWEEIPSLVERMVALLPWTKVDPEARHWMAVRTLDLAAMVLDRVGGFRTLRVGWSTGAGEEAVLRSGVDLLTLDDWEGLAEFLSEDRIVEASLSPEPLAGRPSLLEELLAERRRAEVAASFLPGEVSRNASCPCGSGKRYKRCCGRKG